MKVGNYWSLNLPSVIKSYEKNPILLNTNCDSFDNVYIKLYLTILEVELWTWWR